MNLTAIICGLVGHKPYHPPRKHKWHIWCARCHKELVVHNPHPTPAPYKVEPAVVLKPLTFDELVVELGKKQAVPNAIAKTYPSGESETQGERS